MIIARKFFRNLRHLLRINKRLEYIAHWRPWNYLNDSRFKLWLNLNYKYNFTFYYNKNIKRVCVLFYYDHMHLHFANLLWFELHWTCVAFNNSHCTTVHLLFYIYRYLYIICMQYIFIYCIHIFNILPRDTCPWPCALINYEYIHRHYFHRAVNGVTRKSFRCHSHYG